MKQIYIIIGFLFMAFAIQSQVVYEHVSNTNIYDYLDEMAGLKIIELNSIVKPYPRKMIREKLDLINEASEKDTQLLSKRQKKELKFYLNSYSLESTPPIDLNRKTTLYNKQ